MRWFAGLRRFLNWDVRGARDDNAVCLYVAPLESRRVLSASALVAGVDPVIDDGAGTASSETLITADTGDPVFEILPADLRAWVQEDYQQGSGLWTVDAAGTTVTQEFNGQPTVFYSDSEVTTVSFEVMISVVGERDDDFIGFVLGFQPGDFSNAGADYLLIDWRQADRTGGGVDGLKGLAVSRVTGVADSQWDFWGHQDGVTELARATSLGDQGWVNDVEYRFTIQYSPDRLLIYVNGQLEFDLAAPADHPFPSGRIGFYNYSQRDAVYSATQSQCFRADEGSPLTLTRNFTYSGNGDALAVSIDWGDGTTSPGTVVFADGAGTISGTHTYADNGQYTIRYVLDDGQSGQATGWASAEILNVAPSLSVADRTMTEGGGLLVDLGTFTDPGFGPTETFTYTIDWGDGSPHDSGGATIDVPGSAGVLTAGSFDGSHAYADNGQYTVTVTVADDDGGMDTKTFVVNVGNIPPTLTVVGNQVTTEGAVLEIIDLGTFTDPGFGPTETFTYTIDWGDGSPHDSGGATIDVPGSAGVLTAGSFDGSHAYADNGQYTVTVTVGDDDDGMDTKTFVVNVGNVPPVLTVVGNQTTTEGSILSIIDLGTFTDPGFGPTETFTYTIDWGDGTIGDSGIPTIDVPGSAGVPTAGSFDGSHAYADNGQYTVTVTVADDDGGTDTKTFVVNVGNVPPVLTVVGNQVTTEGAVLEIIDLGTFTDPGSGPTETFTYTIDWGDGTSRDSGIATIDTPNAPTAGSFDGSHTYADDGVYTVTVTVASDDGGMDTKTFVVNVGNIPPTLTVVGNQVTTEGAVLEIIDLGTFTDPGFGPTETFTYTIDWGDGSPHDSGGATIDVPGSAGVLTAGSFDGSHAYADNGQYTVTVTVADDDGGMDTKTFVVNVGNIPPTLTVVGNQVTTEGAVLEIIDLGTLTDPGFGPTETFTYTIDWGDGSPHDSGGATIDVPGSAGVPTAGSFDGSHAYADNGQYTVTVTVADDDGGTDTKTFVVNVGNVPPVLTVVGNQVTTEGAVLEIIDLGTFTDPGFGPTETFTYTIDWGDGTVGDSGMATIDTPGTPTAGSFDGSHTYADDGVYTVTVTVASDDGGMDTKTFVVNVGNIPPTLTVVGNQVTTEGAVLEIIDLGTFTDPGFGPTETFTYTIDWGDGSPHDSGGATIDVPGSAGVLTAGSFDGSHAYADNGQYTVTVTVADDDGGMDTKTFVVNVGNIPPTLTVVGNQVTTEGAVLEIIDLGTFTDPGFGPTETFTYTIDWGDGSPHDSGGATIDVPGSAGVPTAGSFDGSHAYADNGQYTVTVTVADDDGGTDTKTFVVNVGNVPPVLTVVGNQVTTEGAVLEIIDLGTFTDPGSGPTETFTYTIDWGDGTSRDSGIATIDTPGVPTAGSFDGSHTYADDGVYTVTVTIANQHGGKDEETFLVTVENVAPTMLELDDSEVDAMGRVTIQGSYSDPGYDNPLNPLERPRGSRETFTVMVDWGDGTISAIPANGPGTVSFSAGHRYLGPPDPANPAADIRILVTVIDDDGGSHWLETYAEVPGEGVEKFVRIDTTPQVPQLYFPRPSQLDASALVRSSSPLLLSSADLDTVRSDSVAASENYVVLRVVRPSGAESADYRLPDNALTNLPAILSRMPDNHYRIYEIHSDGPERLVRDVFVRQGRVIDYSDASEGIDERPPHSHTTEPSQRVSDDSDGARVDAPRRLWEAWEHVQSQPVAAEEGTGIEPSFRELPPQAADMPGSPAAPSAEPPETASTAYHAAAAPTAGIALLAFRLHSGWNQRADRLLEVFSRGCDQPTKPARWRPPKKG